MTTIHKSPLSYCYLAALAASSAVVEARSLWSSRPADSGPRSSAEYVLKTAYPLGNGRLGATPFGAPGSAGLMLNVDSLWSGGPFEASNYTGGNPLTPRYEALPEIRSTIFQNGTGDLGPLLGSGRNYGSYRVLGNLSIVLDGAEDFSQYRRELDLKTGVHRTTFTSSGQNITEQAFCSFPDQVCVYQVSSSSETGTLPVLNIRFENSLVDQDLINIICRHDMVRIWGITQAGPPEGMKYDAIARLQDQTRGTTSCDRGKLAITPEPGQKSIAFVVGAGTNYDQTKGNAADGDSFRGADPASQVESTASAAANKTFDELLDTHLADYTCLEGAFSLDLPDLAATNSTTPTETSVLISQYSVDGPGNPHLEATLFDYARYMLIASSRSNSLPANLQGRWTEGIDSAWGADYHANINLQMNYWPAEQTGLSETYDALWDYMRHTWVPRGRETARLLYGINTTTTTTGSEDDEDAPAWVVHNEINIFGHTAMKEEAGWANYPLAAAWMMQHVWNNYEYTQNVTWLREQGYPLIKGVARFWLSQLQEDLFTRDGTLVASPCNSPEHGGTTFGCAHYQQEIHHVLDMALSAAPLVGEQDSRFLADVADTLGRLDKGLHVASWGGLKEWKLPESYGLDDVPNTHRHLSHLTGWHPGWAISSFQDGYRDRVIQDAVRETLVTRGTGKADDANAGWAKVWRSACWARLNDTERAYWELRYAVDVNFAPNGLSMYEADEEPFQIDANFGFAGAVLSMLVVDLPLAHDVVGSDDGGEGVVVVRNVVLGPAIPARWGGGSVRGLRIRGGGSVDFSWDEDGLVDQAVVTGSKTKVRLVNVEGQVLAET